MSDRLKYYFILAARLIVGSVFIVSAVGKLIYPVVFLHAVQGYGIIPMSALQPLARAFPWLELLIGVFLLAGLCTRLTAAVAVGLVLFLIGLMTAAVAQGKSIDCGCFVGFVQETIGPLTFARDIVIMLLAVSVSLARFHGPSLDGYWRSADLPPMRVASLMAVVVIGVGAVGLGATSFGSQPNTAPTATSASSGRSSVLTIGRPPGGWRLGPERAKVEIVVFSDFQCPYCREVDATLKRLVSENRGLVALVYRHYPLQRHEYAQAAAEAAEAAGEQGKFWEMHDSIFANQDRLSAADLRLRADLLGLDLAGYDASLASGRPREIVEADRAEGRRLGLEYTPWVIVGGEVVHQHNYEALRAVVERRLRSP